MKNYCFACLSAFLIVLSGCHTASSIAYKPVPLDPQPNTVQVVESKSGEFFLGPNVTRLDVFWTDGSGVTLPLGRETSAHADGVLNSLIQSGGLIGGAAVLRPTRVSTSGGSAEAGAGAESNSNANATSNP